MSNDPKKPLDAPPGRTPELLQQDLSLDRRHRAPTFEPTQPGPQRPLVARQPHPNPARAVPPPLVTPRVAAAPRPPVAAAPRSPLPPSVAPAKPAHPARTPSEVPGALPAHLQVTQPAVVHPAAAEARALEARRAAQPDPIEPDPVEPEAVEPFVTEPTPPFDATPAFEQTVPEATKAPSARVVAEPASLVRRVAAWLVDVLFIGSTSATFVVGAALLIAPKGAVLTKSLLAVVVPALLLTALLAFVYSTLCAFFFRGRTPGRRLLGLHLVDGSGDAPGPVRALLRAGLALVSFGLFLSGFWLALFDRHGQTLHDKLTRTFVVRLLDARPPAA